MEVLRTPDARFAPLHDWPYDPHYADVGDVRMAFVDEGPRDAPPVLLLHGEPTWSFLYRKVIGPLVDAGHRVVAPDLIGFGRSDKPVDIEAHSVAAHVGWLAGLLRELDVRDVTMVGHDWGGIIGLRVLAEDPELFTAVVATNTALPTGDHKLPEEWWRFRGYIESTERLPVGFLVNSGCTTALGEDVLAAYDAPFPEERYKAAVRAMPLLIPTSPDDAASEGNRAAWHVLAGWDKPFLCAFSDSDPLTRGADEVFAKIVPGARGIEHPTIAGAGHFLQEDAGERLADVLVESLSARVA